MYFIKVLKSKIDKAIRVFENSNSSTEEKATAFETIKEAEQELKQVEREEQVNKVTDIIMAGQVKLVKSKINKAELDSMGIDLKAFF